MFQTIRTTILAISFFFVIHVFANQPISAPEDYDKLWKQVEAYMNDGLPKSALKIAEEIYTLAISENNEKQIIKAIVHRMSYIKDLEEDGIKTTILKLETELPQYGGVVKPFMHLFLARMYETYFNNYSYLIHQQSVTAGFENKDIATWDKTKFQNKIIKNYLLALDDILKKEDILEYSEFIEETKESKSCFPTLFDFVAYHITAQLGSSADSYRFDSRESADKLKDNDYLSNVDIFIKLPLLDDTLSYKNTALIIFKEWLKYRLEDGKNIEALINTDLMRLNFVRNNLATANRGKVWEETLVGLQKKYNDVPELAHIIWELASYYNSLGNLYNFQDSTTFINKNGKVKAMELLNGVIERFPDAKYTPNCIALEYNIKKISFSFQVEKIVISNEKFPLRIAYCNSENLYMSILKYDYDKFLEIPENNNFEKYFPELLKNNELFVATQEIVLPKTNDFLTHSTEYLADPLPYGFYIVVLHSKKELTLEGVVLEYCTLFSSDLCLLTKDTKNSNSNLYVLNRKTGQPVENAKIDLYKKEYDRKQNVYVSNKEISVITDKQGYAKINMKGTSSNFYRIDVSYKKDLISEQTNIYEWKEREERKRVDINFFTDRAIYRPGQTVHFKGICLEKQGNDVNIKPKHSVKVDLKDVNWQNIATLNLVSNEYGTISGSFNIPVGVLTGMFWIYCNDGSCDFQVEEYKRPMFEVSTLPVEGEYKLNDKVTIEGKATTYAGTALTDAKVSYTVVRNPLWKPWFAGSRKQMTNSGAPFYGNFSSQEIAFGEVLLNEEGIFTIGFIAEVDDIELLKQYVAYNYTVNVTVTDINGETQTATTAVLVANRALELTSDIKSIVIKEMMDSVSITSQNISGSFVPASVNIVVYKLKDQNDILAKKSWSSIELPLYSQKEWYKEYPGHEYSDETDFSKFEIEKTVSQHIINTVNTKKIKFDGMEKWSSGVYRMVLTSVDKWENRVEEVTEFVLFSDKDSKMPGKQTDFFYVDKTKAQPGEIVHFFVGSAYKNVNMYYDFCYKGETVKSEIIKINAEIKKIAIPIEDIHRGNITVNVMFVKEGRIYENAQTIQVDWENKKLDIKFVTTRNKTLPGANETWQLKISDYLSKPAEAELMASMYDASLDIFAKKSWNLNPFLNYSSPLRWIGYGFENKYSYTYDDFNLKLNFLELAFPNLNLFDIYSYFYGRNRFSAKASMDFCSDFATSENEIILQSVDNSIKVDGILDDEFIMMDKVEMGDIEATGGGISEAPYPQIRSNFSETAFFYPTLTTNEKGEVFLNFTMPESLTRWNFMGLAHTKDLKIGTINHEIVTQKELMIMPHLPRFFRENDKITISAKINNVAETFVHGLAKIEFFDVETLESLNEEFLEVKEVNGVKEVRGVNSVNFEVEKGQNTVVEWQVTVPEGLSAVGIRIIADGRTHSDGEERIIPVLSNRMLVTESMPLPVRKAGTSNFTFKSLANSSKSNTLRHESYTLEFTANPAWYAVQAMPYLMEYPYECAEQTFSRLYANSLSSHIANSDPKIKRVFELWKTIPESKALLSNLEKNQELKALLIEETPWLMNAKNESERKRNLGILFDLNRMVNENNSAIKKLTEAQMSSGGFPWFKGMSENLYITQHIVGGFGRLDKLGVTEVRKNQTVWNMIQKAIQFMDKELEKNYKDLKKRCDDKCMEKDNLGYAQIHYLYVRSFFIKDFPIPQTSVEMFEYYKNQAIKYWTGKDFYMQGMIALSLHKYDEPKISAKIVASLKERAIHSEEMGMYWKYNTGCYWYQAPIETQALLIELFSDVANDKTSVEDMKVWLLKQKQTQNWKTTKATSDAIYAMLLQGANLLAETDYPVITIGDMTIDVAADTEIKTEAGTGYFKQHWDGTQVTLDWSKVSVTKKENSVAWCAVYWQYFEQLDKIKQFEETPLKINKQLFVERREGDKLVIVPILYTANLQIGEKVIVRIEIRCDRDMEYVHLKDMRAACFEPIDYISGYRYKSGLGYYQAIKDASMNFFIDYLRKGTYVFEYSMRVSQKGDFSNGVTTMQSMYAPEFTSHSEGTRVKVE